MSILKLRETVYDWLILEWDKRHLTKVVCIIKEEEENNTTINTHKASQTLVNTHSIFAEITCMYMHYFQLYYLQKLYS